MRCFSLALVTLLGFSLGVSTSQAATLLDFNSGIGAVANHPEPGVFGVWYDITSDAFGDLAAGVLDGSPSLTISDGGFTNGVYILLENAIPATGEYSLSASMAVYEDPAGTTTGIREYQLGAVVNGSHRPHPGDLAAINPASPGSGIGSFVGLTDGDDSVLPTQIVTTTTFSAVAGDDLLIAFSTDVTSGDFNLNAGEWVGSQVFVDNLVLSRVPEPSACALAALALLGITRAPRPRTS